MYNEEVGKTKDAGYQFGIQRTVSLPFHEVWEYMFSGPGLLIWLGRFEGPIIENKDYETDEGDQFFVRVFKEFSHIRMSWKKKAWLSSTVLQVRVIPKDDKSIISFHQEKLEGPAHREKVTQSRSERVQLIQRQLK